MDAKKTSDFVRVMVMIDREILFEDRCEAKTDATPSLLFLQEGVILR